MISQETIQEMIAQQVAAKLTGKSPQEPTIEHSTAPEPPPTPVPAEVITKPLDELDAVKLENILLQKELEKLRKEIEDQRRIFADKELLQKQMDLQLYLTEKYEVDVQKNDLKINTQSRQLVITPK